VVLLSLGELNIDRAVVGDDRLLQDTFSWFVMFLFSDLTIEGEAVTTRLLSRAATSCPKGG
jgi:hypothetical protein